MKKHSSATAHVLEGVKQPFWYPRIRDAVFVSSGTRNHLYRLDRSVSLEESSVAKRGTFRPHDPIVWNELYQQQQHANQPEMLFWDDYQKFASPFSRLEGYGPYQDNYLPTTSGKLRAGDRYLTPNKNLLGYCNLLHWKDQNPIGWLPPSGRQKGWMQFMQRATVIRRRLYTRKPFKGRWSWGVQFTKKRRLQSGWFTHAGPAGQLSSRHRLRDNFISSPGVVLMRELPKNFGTFWGPTYAVRQHLSNNSPEIRSLKSSVGYTSVFRGRAVWDEERRHLLTQAENTYTAPNKRNTKWF